MAHMCNLSILEAEIENQGDPWLHREFKVKIKSGNPSVLFPPFPSHCIGISRRQIPPQRINEERDCGVDSKGASKAKEFSVILLFFCPLEEGKKEEGKS